MRALTVAIFVAIFSLASAFTKEFGSYTNSDVIVALTQGEIGFLEKHKKIELKVPTCTGVSYVLVYVDNDRAEPRVGYDHATRTVTIAYGLFEHSKSKYVVLAKGRHHMEGCGDPAPYPSDDVAPHPLIPDAVPPPCPNVYPYHPGPCQYNPYDPRPTPYIPPYNPTPNVVPNPYIPVAPRPNVNPVQPYYGTSPNVQPTPVGWPSVSPNYYG